MEKEAIKIFMEMLTGMLLLVISSMAFWYSTEIAGFMFSIVTGIIGFLLMLSKMLVLREVGLTRHIWFMALVGFFLFLIVSFIPFWCFEYIPPGYEFPKCMYVDFWLFFFG